jgi:hypothetical protein
VNGIDELGWSPLLSAILEGQKEKVKLLLTKGANPESVHGCMNILHCAALSGSEEIMKLCLEKLSDKKKKEFLLSPDDLGNTPLHIIFKKGFAEIISLFKGVLADENLLSLANRSGKDLLYYVLCHLLKDKEEKTGTIASLYQVLKDSDKKKELTRDFVMNRLVKICVIKRNDKAMEEFEKAAAKADIPIFTKGN